MTAEYLLDSKIIIAALNGTSRSLLNRLAGIAPQRVHLSTFVLAELLTGVEKQGASAPARRVSLNELVDGMNAISFNAKAADVQACIRAATESKGHTIGPMDLLIAAQAVSRGLVLVTDNLREFRRVPNLICENWLR